ncbi:MAG: hypothetical protein R6U84_06290 [Candidatus Cloacimonadales bacterium]
MDIKFVIASAVIIGVICLLSIIGLIVRSGRKKLTSYIQKKFDQSEIIGATTKANFFGLKSKAGKQIRGNAAIILTKKQLVSLRALPFQAYSIPIKSIQRVSLPQTFNGKSIFAKLLCVHFTNESCEDSIAWAIQNPEKWKESIEALLTRS